MDGEAGELRKAEALRKAGAEEAQWKKEWKEGGRLESKNRPGLEEGNDDMCKKKQRLPLPSPSLEFHLTFSCTNTHGLKMQAGRWL